jgi:peptidoglycan/xylan/chitin deacetylase (PgdA/CDA1 family)
MLADQSPVCPSCEDRDDWDALGEPLPNSRPRETGGSGRHRPHWSLSTLLLLIAVAIACNSFRASGAQHPRIGVPKVADGVKFHAPEAHRGVANPRHDLNPHARSASTELDSIGTVALPEIPRPLAPPNEVGQILILEYHAFTTDPAQASHWVRTIDDFRADLEWLYEHNFAVVPLRDVFLNRIAAPRGKHPVVLTFDDGTAGQFRFLPQSDGALRVDPNSAVGVLEEMFARYPDFGRGGHFAVLPFNCFHVPNEPDQEPYCQEKLRWLDAHGYEVGNHTTGHTDLRDIDDLKFKSTIGDAIDWARAAAPGSSPDILTMPFGKYPDSAKHPEQMRWLREGFVYEGRQVTLLGALMVGGGPAPSPVSVLWNPVKVPRIQAANKVLSFWKDYCKVNADLLYTSDGDPGTITILRDQPPQLQGAFDPDRASGKLIVID